MSVSIKSNCLVIIITIVAFNFICTVATQSTCNRGEKLIKPSSGPKVCYKCDDGTYMSETNHSHTECYNCSAVTNPDVEEIVSKCNETNDTEKRCKTGYYRVRVGSNSTCSECTVCSSSTPFLVLKCQEYNDTVCCPEINHIVSYNEQGLPVCKMPYCGQGHYLDENAETCVSCPNGTFISEERHARSSCQDCYRINPDSHVIIKRPCNSTHQAMVLCENGYFNENNHYDSLECGRCTVCEGYVFQKCKSDSDSVCGNSSTRSSMTEYLLTTSSPGINQTLCQNGSYLNANNNTCTPCDHGTFLDEMNHKKTVCLNCLDFKGIIIPSTCLSEISHSSPLTVPEKVGLAIGIVAIITIVVITIIIIYCFRKRILCFRNIPLHQTNRRYGENGRDGANTQQHTDLLSEEPP